MMILHILMLFTLIVASILGLFSASIPLNLTITVLFFLVDLFIAYVLVRESRVEVFRLAPETETTVGGSEISEGTASQNLLT